MDLLELLINFLLYFALLIFLLFAFQVILVFFIRIIKYLNDKNKKD